MDPIRKKRSNESNSVSRKHELEQQLAALRDQELVLQRTIELLAASRPGAAPEGPPVAPGLPRPTAELKDFEFKQHQFRDAQNQRQRAVWNDVRKIISSLRSNKNVAALFGIPVKETPWGAQANNYERYRSVVSHPMDLRTMKEKVGEDSARRQYREPAEVVADVDLIIKNCLDYNVGNMQVRSIADQLKTHFQKRWQDSAIQAKWQRLNQLKRADDEELADLERAAKGSIADKIRYFDNCIRRRLAELRTPHPAAGQQLSWEQKRKLSLACSRLKEPHCYGLIEIIARSGEVENGAQKSGASDSGSGGSVELEVELDQLPDATLFQLQEYIDKLSEDAFEAEAAPAATQQGASVAAAVAPQAGTAKGSPAKGSPVDATPAASPPRAGATATVASGAADALPADNPAAQVAVKAEEQAETNGIASPAATAKEKRGSAPGSAASSSSGGSSSSSSSSSASSSSSSGEDGNTETATGGAGTAPAEGKAGGSQQGESNATHASGEPVAGGAAAREGGEAGKAGGEGDAREAAGEDDEADWALGPEGPAAPGARADPRGSDGGVAPAATPPQAAGAEGPAAAPGGGTASDERQRDSGEPEDDVEASAPDSLKRKRDAEAEVAAAMTAAAAAPAGGGSLEEGAEEREEREAREAKRMRELEATTREPGDSDGDELVVGA